MAKWVKVDDVKAHYSWWGDKEERHIFDDILNAVAAEKGIEIPDDTCDGNMKLERGQK